MNAKLHFINGLENLCLQEEKEGNILNNPSLFTRGQNINAFAMSQST
jgi:hypothetical protein